jgi:hypothetical protein
LDCAYSLSGNNGISTWCWIKLVEAIPNSKITILEYVAQPQARTLSITSLNGLTKTTISSHKLTQSLTLTCSVSGSKGVDSTVAAKLMAVLNTTKLTNLRCVAVVWLNTKHNSF